MACCFPPPTQLPSYGLVVTEATLKHPREHALRRFVSCLGQVVGKYIYSDHVDEAVAAMMRQRAAEKLDAEILKGQIVGYRLFS